MSNKTMTITDISKSSKNFKDTHTIQVGGFGKTKQPPAWFIEFEKKNDERWAKQEEFNKQQLEFNKLILSRIDNLENLVVTQFKKHGWVK